MKHGTARDNSGAPAGSCALALTSGEGSEQRRSPGHAVYGMQGVRSFACRHPSERVGWAQVGGAGRGSAHGGQVDAQTASNRTHVGDAVLAAASMTEVIVLPGASSAEGIAAGRGATFYAGDLFTRRHLPRRRPARHRRAVHRRPRRPHGRRHGRRRRARPAVRRRRLHRAGLRLRHSHRRDRGHLPVRRRRPPRSSTTWPSPRTAPGSPTRSRPSSTSCRSAGPASRGTFRTLALSGPAADTSGDSTSTASRPPPTARP